MKKLNLASIKPVGWREWISIPEWGIDFIKAKVDTGARTSSIHVEDIEKFTKDGKSWVRFKVFPYQKDKKHFITTEAPLIDRRQVRSSSGHQEHRPVVLVQLVCNGIKITSEVTLSNRDQMGFRMLLGRQALKGTFAVISDQSYLGGKPPKEIEQLNRGKK